jgi:hypothetical protein
VFTPRWLYEYARERKGRRLGEVRGQGRRVERANREGYNKQTNNQENKQTG